MILYTRRKQAGIHVRFDSRTYTAQRAKEQQEGELVRKIPQEQYIYIDDKCFMGNAGRIKEVILSPQMPDHWKAGF